MESRGIIRRVDELGRIVLPREMRKMLNVKEGSRLEIGIVDNDKFLLSKYSPISTLKEYSEAVLSALSECIDHIIFITDNDEVLSSNKKKYSNKKLSIETQELICKRDLVIKKTSEGAEMIKIFEDMDKEICCQLLVPIIKDGDVLGSVIVLAVEDKCFDTDTVKICKCFSKLLSELLV